MTITLTSKALRTAVVDRLILSDVAAGDVVHAPPAPFQAEDLVAGAARVGVFCRSATATNRSKPHVPRFDRSERVNIVAMVRLVEGGEYETKARALHDAIDDLETAIFDSLLSSRDFAKLEWSGYEVAKGFEVKSKNFEGHLRIEFTVTWRHQVALGPDPVSPGVPGTDDRLQVVKVQVDIDGDGETRVADGAATEEPDVLIDGLDT